MPRFPNPIFLLLLAVSRLVSGDLHAANVELIGGKLATQPDGRVVLSLEVPSHRLPLFAHESPGVYQKWFQVRQREADILATFREGLRQRVGEQEVAAAKVAFPTLDATPPSGDDTDLPDFVMLTATWDSLPEGGELVTQFAIPDTKVVLTLEEPSGRRVGIFSENGDTGTAAGSAQPAEGSVPVPAESSFWPRLWLGFAHVVPRGIDHLLFLLGLCLAASRARQVWGQVAVFTLAHVLTLGLAVGGFVEIDAGWSRAVDLAIAFSLVLLAAENILTRGAPGWRRLGLVALLGLIHGLGFAGTTTELRSAPGWVASSLGLALGQAVVVAVVLALTAWGRRHAWYRGWLVVPGSAAVGLGGLVLVIQIAGAP